MRFQRKSLVIVAIWFAAGSFGCNKADTPPAAPVYDVANGCFLLGAIDPGAWPTLLSVLDDESGYGFGGGGTPFFLKASRLGAYLFYDDAGSFLVSDGVGLQREAQLLSDVTTIDDTFESEAEWELFETKDGAKQFMRHRRSGRYLTTTGLVDSTADAADVKLLDSKNCAEFPEATVDAEGEVQPTHFEDGSLYGIVDTHSHILSNFAFGGGGIFHGAPFHPLGIEHALADCELYHGPEGRRDLFGFGFDNPGDTTSLLLAFLTGELDSPNHATAGYPEFTDWPNAPKSSTHQVQYYKWLERAYLGGLRLVVQHATSNQIICDLITGIGAQATRYACNDMVNVDRIVDETYAMQDYIDAQEGGPGEGWFRVVTSPAAAREVIGAGKMAVILGIETSNLFDCFLTPSAEHPACTEQDVLDRLDAYHARGVRAIFPVHKYDNGFSAGDGDKVIIELGNFIQTGHRNNFTTEDCPDIPTTFDKGVVNFPGVNRPRDDFFAPALFDFSNFPNDPVNPLLPVLVQFLQPPGTAEVCQNAGLTPLGEFLVEQMMLRGMILEIDHLPRRSYRRVFEMMEQNDYPAAGTHGLNNRGELYALGGVSKSGFGRCRSETETATVDDGYQARIAQIEDMGGFPAEGFGFDLNGFAGAQGPRFGPDGCSNPQEDPVTYPFESYAGDVTFTAPSIGDRALDFNTEGLVHIGLLPEMIEDVRGDGVSDSELEPLFKSAEGYLRMWEKAEARAAALQP